jgi:hypothetical protein
MPYTDKYWKTKADYDKGEAIDAGTKFSKKSGKIKGLQLLITDQVFAVEMYNTVTGETVYHTEE